MTGCSGNVGKKCIIVIHHSSLKTIAQQQIAINVAVSGQTQHLKPQPKC